MRYRKPISLVRMPAAVRIKVPTIRGCCCFAFIAVRRPLVFLYYILPARLTEQIADDMLSLDFTIPDTGTDIRERSAE